MNYPVAWAWHGWLYGKRVKALFRLINGRWHKHFIKNTMWPKDVPELELGAVFGNGTVYQGRAGFLTEEEREERRKVKHILPVGLGTAPLALPVDSRLFGRPMRKAVPCHVCKKRWTLWGIACSVCKVSNQPMPVRNFPPPRPDRPDAEAVPIQRGRYGLPFGDF